MRTCGVSSTSAPVEPGPSTGYDRMLDLSADHLDQLARRSRRGRLLSTSIAAWRTVGAQ